MVEIVGLSVSKVCGLSVFDVVHGGRERWWVGCRRRRCSVEQTSIWRSWVVLRCEVSLGGAGLGSVVFDVLCYGGGVIEKNVEGVLARRYVR